MKANLLFLVGFLVIFFLVWVFVAVVVGLVFWGFFHYTQVHSLKAEGPCKQETVLG